MAYDAEPNYTRVSLAVDNKLLDEAKLAALANNENLAGIIRTGIKLRLGELAADPKFQDNLKRTRSEIDKHARLLSDPIEDITGM